MLKKPKFRLHLAAKCANLAGLSSFKQGRIFHLGRVNID